MTPYYFKEEEIFGYLCRWKETIAPFLKDCVSLRIDNNFMDVIESKGDSCKNHGWIIHFSLNGHCQSSYCDWWLYSSDDLSVIPEDQLNMIVKALIDYNFAKSALALLAETDT